VAVNASVAVGVEVGAGDSVGSGAVVGVGAHAVSITVIARAVTRALQFIVFALFQDQSIES
jgi:hypothetical protein